MHSRPLVFHEQKMLIHFFCGTMREQGSESRARRALGRFGQKKVNLRKRIVFLDTTF